MQQPAPSQGARLHAGRAPAADLARVLRDHLPGWALLAMATPVLILAIIGLLALATTPLLALALSLLLPVGMGLMAALTEERARRIIRWTLDCRDVWAFNRDDRSLAPMHDREWRGGPLGPPALTPPLPHLQRLPGAGTLLPLRWDGRVV